MNHEAIDRVAIGRFYHEEYTATTPIRGVVHVGANDGYEVQWYQKLALSILCFEPLESAVNRFLMEYAVGIEIELYQMALGNIDGRAKLHVVEGGGGGSSFLPEPTAVDHKIVGMKRWATLVSGGEIITDRFNACVIDVQGMELDVLRGMDEYISAFDYFVIECSAKPIYKGGAYASEVVTFMDRAGFDQISPICPHDDVFFVKKGLAKGKIWTPPSKVPVGSRLNLGSGQRPFDPECGWINIDSQEKWKPEMVGDIRDLSVFPDNSIDMVVLHHVLEHFGCGEADGIIKESWRVMKPGAGLLVFIPDPDALHVAWKRGGISEQIYMTNMFGAYMGDEADRHKWQYSRQGLVDYLRRVIPQWHDVHAFNWRILPGADFARDYWITAIEAVK
jgi:FkbM family methyltransferase